jgi:hypothetical protein
MSNRYVNIRSLLHLVPQEHLLGGDATLLKMAVRSRFWCRAITRNVTLEQFLSCHVAQLFEHVLKVSS